MASFLRGGKSGGSIQNDFKNREEEIGWGVWRHFLEYLALTVKY